METQLTVISALVFAPFCLGSL